MVHRLFVKIYGSAPAFVRTDGGVAERGEGRMQWHHGQFAYWLDGYPGLSPGKKKPQHGMGWLEQSLWLGGPRVVEWDDVDKSIPKVTASVSGYEAL